MGEVAGFLRRNHCCANASRFVPTPDVAVAELLVGAEDAAISSSLSPSSLAEVG